MKILVIGGGDGTEREVSLRSCAAVQDGLTQLGHVVTFLDYAGGDEAIRTLAAVQDLILPIMHGTGGEDGQIQAILTPMGVPYLGSDMTASALCFDKVRLKALLRAHDILTPMGEVVTAESFAKSPLTQAAFVLKPISDGSSMDTMIVRHLPYDSAKADALLQKRGQMLLEALIIGTEITVPILGDKALPVIEIIPPPGKDFDFENKYNGATAELCPPVHVSAALQAQACELALKIHTLAGARHLSRSDFIIDAQDQLYVLEINTMPGMTRESLYPKSAAEAGLSWKRLVERLVELAITSG